MRGLLRTVATVAIAVAIGMVGVFIITGGTMDLSPYWQPRDRAIEGPGDAVWLYPFLP